MQIIEDRSILHISQLKLYNVEQIIKTWKNGWHKSCDDCSIYVQHTWKTKEIVSISSLTLTVHIIALCLLLCVTNYSVLQQSPLTQNWLHYRECITLLKQLRITWKKIKRFAMMIHHAIDVHLQNTQLYWCRSILKSNMGKEQPLLILMAKGV